MKKALKLFLLFALAVTALSCTHKDLEYRHKSVSPTFTAGVSTKADGNLWTKDQIGINVISSPSSSMSADYVNVPYTTDADGVTEATFTADDIEIEFEDADETVTFIAYAPYSSTASVTTLPGTDGDGVIVENTESQATAARQTALDFLYAGEATGSEELPTVVFNFSHVMTQLTINIVAGDGVSSDDVADGSYVLGGIIHDGAFDVNPDDAALGTAYLTGTEADEDWDLTTNWYPVEGSSYDASYSCLVFPQTPESLALSATIGSLSYNAIDLLSSLDDGEFLAGNSYVYTITVTTTDMSVTGCTINDWIEHDYDITVGGGIDTEGVGTSLSPYSVADIHTLADAGKLPEEAVYVSGYVTEVGDLNETDGELTYSIADASVSTNSVKQLDDEETVTLLINNGFGLGGAQITDAAYLSVNDEVVVYGTLGTGDDGVEVVTGSIIYSLNGETYDDSDDQGDDEEEADYNSNVTFTLGEHAEEHTATVNGSDDTYYILKLGTASNTASATCKIPAGSTSFGFYVVAWNGASNTPYKITIGETEYSGDDYLCQGNTGLSGTTYPYALVDVSQSDYKLIEFDALSEDTTVTVETLSTGSDKRAGFFGVKYFPTDLEVEETPVETEGEGTEDSPYTVADAYALVTANQIPEEEVYVSGIVCSVGSFNSSYGELTYYISDDGTTSNDMEVYNGLGLDGDQFTSADDLSKGDAVVVCGTLQSYNNAPEFNYGSKIVSLVESEGGDDEEVEQNEAYVSNVTWTAGDHAEVDDVVIIDKAKYSALKFGTSSANGSATCTLPVGATSFSFYCAAWNGKTVPIKVTLGETEILTGTASANSGVNNSSPFTLESSEFVTDGDGNKNYFSATFDALTVETTLTFESTGSGYRGVVFGAKYAPEESSAD